MRGLHSEEDIKNEICMLKAKMLELHAKAWKYRVEGDPTAMRNAHRVIGAYKKRIKDCEWAIEYVQVT